MTNFTKILTGAAGIAMVAGAAAPAAAQYAPNYGYNSGGSAIGQVINQVLGGGRYGAYGQGNDRVAVDQCARAAETRVSRDYRATGYGNNPQSYGHGNHGYNQQGYGANAARVVGITSVERKSSGLKIMGVIDSGRSNRGYGNQGYGYANQQGYDPRYQQQGYDPRYQQQGYDPRYQQQGHDPRYQQQGYGNQAYANNSQVADLRFSCRVDFRGYVTSLDIKRNVASRY